MRTCVDRGGTFTDIVTVDERGVRIRKVPSDVAVVGELAEGELIFGTTVATNALLERAGVDTVAVVAEGFADLPWIRDMTRPALFDPDARWPDPLCARSFEVQGRLDAQGREIRGCATETAAPTGLPAARAYAVALPHSVWNPHHEQIIAASIQARFPGAFVSMSHQVDPLPGYLPRLETTLVDAAITPILTAALSRDRIPADARVMRSDGSLVAASQIRAPEAVLSGPAGGVLAVAAIAAAAGYKTAIGLDMGGTSTDVCIVEGDLPWRAEGAFVAGVRVRRPQLEVETIAAGGGSILSTDGRALQVGPESAGANPGPQCRGRGGPPTLTDAMVVAGLVDPAAFTPPLDPTQIRLPGPAEGFLEVAREAMAAAVRRIADGRGIDVRTAALVAYGGAGAQHAARVADRLGVTTVLVHPCSSVLCAFGQLLARREEVATRPLWGPFDERAHRAADELEASLPRLGETLRTVALSHPHADPPIEVALGPDSLARFTEAHQRRFGFTRDLPIEVRSVSVRVREPLPSLPPVAPLDVPPTRGPAVLHTPTTSIEIPDGWAADHHRGLLRLRRATPARTESPTTRTETGVALWSSRFGAVATSAGAVLQRLARSVSIRDRRDFSCAIFDADGGIVANAPHVPVHLGAMGEVVRDLIARGLTDPHQSYLSNDPEAGGSHLPDLTVITPVEHDGHRFFVGSRGHHVDVGGSTPGSMPPDATRLSDEGFVVRGVPMRQGGRRRDLRPLLVGCRQPDVVEADLDAQIASNAHAARLLCELAHGPTLTAWMAHLHDVAHEAILDVIATLRPGEAEDTLDGVPLRVRLIPAADGLTVDFAGTGGPHPTNKNAPRAVVRAAVLYALRLLVRRPIPLVEGALRSVQIRTPRGSIVDPPAGVAVAGGNVETSQRIVDLVLRAADARAAGQGTMNNLTLGGDGWSWYETIGGGEGASRAGPGASARQVHMTNTRATDVEIAELRLPIRIERMQIRRGSGGAGTHSGGDGIIREIEVLGPSSASLLASSRDQGASGLAGGARGLPAADSQRVGGEWTAWNGDTIPLGAGDRVRIETPGGGGWGSAG